MFLQNCAKKKLLKLKFERDAAGAVDHNGPWSTGWIGAVVELVRRGNWLSPLRPVCALGTSPRRGGLRAEEGFGCGPVWSPAPTGRTQCDGKRTLAPSDEGAVSEADWGRELYTASMDIVGAD